MRTKSGMQKSHTKGKHPNQEYEMNLLLEQVYGILQNQKNSWSPKNEELYSLLERVIFLKARENTFRDFFDNMEDVIESLSKLDFSKRVPISEVSLDKRNLFNYAVMCLNIIAEKMESSVVSMKAVNTLCSMLPETIAIVTNNTGVIRFINETGEKQLGKRSLHIGKSISLLFPDFEKTMKSFGTNEIKNRPVKLISNYAPKRTLQFLLTIPKPYTDSTEIEEIVYLFNSSISINSSTSEVSRVHLGHFLFDLLKDLRKDELYKEMKFDVTVEYDVELYTDPILFRSLIEQIFYFANLRSFGKKSFTQISACNLNEHELVIRIHDNGIGMRPSEKEEIKTSNSSGTILGKVIEIVSLLNASIDCYSRHSRGTTFTIKFPRL